MRFTCLGLFLFIVTFSDAGNINVTPKDSIQDAIETAKPGDTVVLADGLYEQDIVSVRDGSPDNRITITGSRKAIVNGKKDGASRMIQINHSYITLDGFTVDGKKNSGKNSEDFVDKLIYVLGKKKPELIRSNGVEYESSLDGMIISNMLMINGGGECLRLRSFITNAEIVGNKIENCGVHDFAFPSSTVNGEVIYVGTSSNQWFDGKNSRSGPDLTKFVWIHENEMISKGNELDVKEGTTDVLVEHNVFSDQRDPNSGCLDSRTDDIIFRYNDVSGCLGAGIRIGGHTIDGHTYGENNEVYGNFFQGTEYASVKIETGKSHTFCENTCNGGCSSRGSLGKQYQNIEDKCPNVREISWTTPGKVNKPKIEQSNSITPKTEEEEEELIREETKPSVSGKVKPNDSGSSSSSESSSESSSSSSSESSSESSSDSSDDNRRLVSIDDTVCVPVTIEKVSSSSEEFCRLAVDGKSVPRWSSNGKGQWIGIDLKMETEVDSLKMDFYKGDERIQYFDIYADGKPLLLKSESSGKTVGLQSFSIDPPMLLKEITIFGQGNSENDWNSFHEMIICGDEKGTHDTDLDSEEEECNTFELGISGVIASSDDGNVAENVLGKDLKTKWSCNTSPCELLITLSEPSYVAELEFAVYLGNKRSQKYDLLVNTGSRWEDVVIDGSSYKQRGIQSADIDVNDVSQIKFIGYGNDVNEWSSLLSVDVIGC